MPSQSSRKALTRKKLDFTQRTSTGTYKCDSLKSHFRDVDKVRDVIPLDTVKDRALTETSDESEYGSSSSSSGP
jgi:hypothetical protein